MKEQLPAQVLAALFSNSLVYTGESLQPVITEEKIQPPAKWYLGNNEKKIVVLVSDDSNVYLSDENLQFLTGVLNACKLNLAQIALINLYNHPVNFQRLKQDLQPAFIVAFGINALQMELPFSMPDYQVQQYSNCSILTAPALNELNQTTAVAKAEKTKLWNCLKKMLNL